MYRAGKSRTACIRPAFEVGETFDAKVVHIKTSFASNLYLRLTLSASRERSLVLTSVFLGLELLQSVLQELDVFGNIFTECIRRAERLAFIIQ